MPAIRHDDLLLRVIRDLNDVRSALRRVVATLPLYDIDNENSPAQITANQNNYIPGNFDVLRLSSSKNVVITGIANGVKGRKLRIFNYGNYKIIFTPQSTLSIPANRFNINYDIQIGPGESIQFYYDITTSRWVLFAKNTVPYSPEFTYSTVALKSWTSIAWSPALGLFAAVANNNTTSDVMTSPDGLVWTSRTTSLGAGQTWVSVCWSPALGMFCAVGITTPYVMTSTNGILWTTHVGQIGIWGSVCWSPALGMFCAVANNAFSTNAVMTSTDGTIWTARVATTTTWGSVCWSPALGMFCAVANSGVTRVMTSTNGVLWTNQASTINTYSVTWSPELGIFCAVGAGVFQTSTNGTAWTTGTISAELCTSLNSIVWSPELGIFMAVGVSSAPMVPPFYSAATSMNGTTWYPLKIDALSDGGSWGGLAWSPDLNIFCAVAHVGTSKRAAISP